MTGANFHIPAGTPLLSRDGTWIVARFKQLQGLERQPSEVLSWRPLPNVSSPTYDDGLLKFEDEPPVISQLSARCRLKTPALQVWQLDAPDSEFEGGPFEQFFPPFMFTRPPDTPGLKIADAIETVLGHDYTAQMLKWTPEVATHLESYRQYLITKGTHHGR